MNNKFLLPIIILVIILIAIAGFIWFWFLNSTPAPVQTQNKVEYVNDQYGFSVALLDSWTGYSVVTSTWNGDTTSANGQVQVSTVQGPMISLRNPLWTGQKPYQDIPVMIFTTSQWNDMQQDKFHIGAAPINPSELGSNTSYVFALPARYNFAYPEGWQEADQIIQSMPLKTFAPVAINPEHCGGNIANPSSCISGYYCAPDPSSHLPFGDVGGICVRD
jgi:hypothetical protein